MFPLALVVIAVTVLAGLGGAGAVAYRQLLDRIPLLPPPEDLDP